MEEISFFYILVIFGVFASACSQLLLKISANTSRASLVRSLLNWRVIVAYTIFCIALIINIAAMSYGVDLKDLPILEALGYIFVPCLSWIILKESISKRTIISIIFIFTGILFFYL